MNAFTSMFRSSALALPAGILALIVLMIVPVPAFMLDVSFVLNIALSVAILMAAMNAEKPLDFSSFPTVLLFATLHLNPPALIPILVLSLVLCFAYRRTGSIVPSIVGHALNNTAAFCILYFTNAPL